MADKPEFNEAAPARDGDDFMQLFAAGIREAEDPILSGGGSSRDLRLFDHVRSDPQIWSTLQQRRDAVVSIPWEVAAGDEDDPRSVDAADELREQLNALDFDTRCRRMLWAVFYGYGVAEIMWEIRGNQFAFGAIKVRKARRFGFDVDGRLMLRRTAKRNEEAMPDRKFWVMATGADTDDEPYGLGLGHLLYWPAYFKRHGLKAWMKALNKYATPTAVGKYPTGTPEKDIKTLLHSLAAMANDSAIVIPEGMTAELLQAAKSAGMDYRAFHEFMEGMVAKIVLSQTMTTDDGSSRAQAETHMDVRDEVADADSALLCGSFNEGPVTWWTEWNYGADVAPPLVRREKIEQEDADAAATRDESLSRIGWHPTPERVQQVYGAGYVYRKPGKTTSEGDDPPALAAGESDALEDFADALVKAGAMRTAANDLLAPIAEAIDAAGSLEDMRAALDDLGEGDLQPMQNALAEAMFAARIGGEVGAALHDDVALEES